METILNSINSMSMDIIGETFTKRELVSGIVKGAIGIIVLWTCVYALNLMG